MNERDKYFMQRAIDVAQKGVDEDIGGPFGAVVVKDDRIVAEVCNCVTSTNDPTAHAEVTAIRKACKELNTYQLDDCVIYTSCEPCPMCLGAIYWAHIKTVYYACTREDAAEIKFDDSFIYDQISKDIDRREVKFVKIMRNEALPVFKNWNEKENKPQY